MPAVLPSPRLPKGQILALVQAISGVQCVWSTAKRPQLGAQPGLEHAWIELTAQSWRGIGVDELRQVLNPVTNALDNMTIGQRAFTLVLKAKSLDLNLEAFDLLERVRFRIRSAGARAIMVPTLALVDLQPIQTFPESTYSVGAVSRVLLTASMDVRMACVVAAPQGDAGDGDFITVAPVPTPAPGGNLLP